MATADIIIEHFLFWGPSATATFGLVWRAVLMVASGISGVAWVHQRTSHI